jgi:hypothetical protein
VLDGYSVCTVVQQHVLFATATVVTRTSLNVALYVVINYCLWLSSHVSNLPSYNLNGHSTVFSTDQGSYCFRECDWIQHIWSVQVRRVSRKCQRYVQCVGYCACGCDVWREIAGWLAVIA